ncbi:hypothetical protein ES705_43531 [subsurface metagenome]
MRGGWGFGGRGETNTVDNVDNLDLNILKNNSTGHLVDVVATGSLQFKNCSTKDCQLHRDRSGLVKHMPAL